MLLIKIMLVSHVQAWFETLSSDTRHFKFLYVKISISMCKN